MSFSTSRKHQPHPQPRQHFCRRRTSRERTRHTWDRTHTRSTRTVPALICTVRAAGTQWAPLSKLSVIPSINHRARLTAATRAVPHAQRCLCCARPPTHQPGHARSPRASLRGRPRAVGRGCNRLRVCPAPRRRRPLPRAPTAAVCGGSVHLAKARHTPAHARLESERLERAWAQEGRALPRAGGNAFSSCGLDGRMAFYLRQQCEWQWE